MLITDAPGTVVTGNTLVASCGPNIEVTGTSDKIEAFESMVRPFGLVEMVRTGEIAIARGRGET